MWKRYSMIIKLHLYFFKSTVTLTIIGQLICVLLYFFSMETIHFSESSISQQILLIPLGLLFDLLYKELTYKEIYYFYFNQAIQKISLWISAFCGWLLVLMSFNLILRLCVNVWKWIA